MVNRAQLTACLLLLVCILSCAIAGKDYYDILQVPKGAGDSQIKRAYRKLALQYHPDKVKGTDEEKQAAAKRFAEISHAYEVLSDEEKRQIYDRYGEEGVKQHDAQGGSGGGGAADLFSQFFGGRGGFGGFGFGGGEEEEETPKGNDVIVPLEVTLKELYLGTHIKITRDKNVVKPAKGRRKCNCKNRVVTRQLGPGMFQQYTQQECEDCAAVQYARETEELTIAVDAGMRDGAEIVFFEEGEPMIDGEHGDLRFIIRTVPHERFVRKGDDLHYEMTITLEDALVGFSRQVEHFDGHLVTIANSDVTIPGQVQLIPNEGMPLHDQGHQHGSLFVTFTVDFPKNLSEPQKALVRKLASSVHEEL